MISKGELKSTLGTELKVKVDKTVKRELDQYCKDRSGSSRGGELDLCSFLEAVGLPPQTFGKASSKPEKSKRPLLKREELDAGAKLLNRIRKEMESAGNTKKGSSTRGLVFSQFSIARRKGDDDLSPDAFEEVVARVCGSQFCNRYEVKEHLRGNRPSLVLYLAEENPDMISYAKLEKALKQREGDPPLE